MSTHTHVLILCTHNSARSILSEGMLNHLAKQYSKNIQAFSAGSSPSGRVNHFALDALANAGIDPTQYTSKSWDIFTRPDSPKIDIVITVCDNAAAEQCPYWPGSPVTTHWGYPDPSCESEEKKPRAFELTRQAIGYKMMQLIQLPLGQMSAGELKAALSTIARS